MQLTPSHKNAIDLLCKYTHIFNQVSIFVYYNAYYTNGLPAPECTKVHTDRYIKNKVHDSLRYIRYIKFNKCAF